MVLKKSTEKKKKKKKRCTCALQHVCRRYVVPLLVKDLLSLHIRKQSQNHHFASSLRAYELTRREKCLFGVVQNVALPKCQGFQDLEKAYLRLIVLTVFDVRRFCYLHVYKRTYIISRSTLVHYLLFIVLGLYTLLLP